MQGVICANFYWRLLVCPPCQKMRCGPCYNSSKQPEFPCEDPPRLSAKSRKQPKRKRELEVGLAEKVSKQDTFKVGRNGDHVLTPYKYDLCIFRELKK